MVLAGVALGLVILANIASLVTNRVSPDGHSMPRPTTMTKTLSDSFARQQSGEATYMKGMDRDRKTNNVEDTVLGQGSGLAGMQGDDFDEVDGVSQKDEGSR